MTDIFLNIEIALLEGVYEIDFGNKKWSMRFVKSEGQYIINIIDLNSCNKSSH